MGGGGSREQGDGRGLWDGLLRARPLPTHVVKGRSFPSASRMGASDGLGQSSEHSPTTTMAREAFRTAASAAAKPHVPLQAMDVLEPPSSGPSRQPGA